MKNVHVLPTSKPSRLIIYSTLLNEFRLLDEPIEDWKHKRNIYITSDEEIKKGDWCYQVEINDGKVDKCYDVTLYHTWTNNGVDKTRKFKKIILTTDQDLIKDGVQAVEEDFLNWFIKNPSCERVEILEAPKLVKMIDNEFCKIIIPKEEPKQETLEEAKQKILDSNYMNKNDADIFEMGVKWQQERMYSEEEVISFLQKYRLDLSSNKTAILGDTTKQWFEQFKNK